MLQFETAELGQMTQSLSLMYSRYGGFAYMGDPHMENAIEMDDLGVAPLSETSVPQGDVWSITHP